MILSDRYNRGRYFLVILFLAGIWMMFLPSCEHEPLDPVIPDPGDTIENPIDTMNVDTMGVDTMGVPCDSNVVYFNKDILPILNSTCAKSGCHDAASHEEDLILDSYQNVMAANIVKPNDLDGSDLYKVITSSDPDKRMPQPPNTKLTTNQILIISKWILLGAKDLSCDQSAGLCDTSNVSYSGFVVPLITNYCIGCHSGAAPSGNLSLSSYPGIQTVALNGKLLGAITWTNGYVKMPKNSNKLSACNINKIKAWINDGAQNN